MSAAGASRAIGSVAKHHSQATAGIIAFCPRLIGELSIADGFS